MVLKTLHEKVVRDESVHMTLEGMNGKGTLQWFLEKRNKAADHPITYGNLLSKPYICGEEAFKQIYTDIYNAKASIDIVCWGFDPGMQLIREGDKWSNKDAYGELLLHKARQGVKVRLLVWYDTVASAKQNNLPGYTSDLASPCQFAEAKYDYCTAWWEQVRKGVPGLFVRLRGGNADQIAAQIKNYFPEARHPVEEWLLESKGTHHQKPILIDYEAVGTPNARPCGYVIGFNSITDYWDTSDHRFNDPLRENRYDAPARGNFGTGRQRVLENRKPYRDYGVRLEGEALYCLNRNFANAWKRAKPFGVDFGQDGLAPERSKVTSEQLRARNSKHAVQIVRTQPEEDDVTILESYLLATANAKNYLYIENQYFQLAPWARFLKEKRQQYREAVQKAGAKPAQMNTLYVFIVTPQPEDGGMVPRTYDALAELGQGEAMGGYHQEVKNHRDVPRPADNKSWVDQVIYPFKVMRREGQSSEIRDSAAIDPPEQQARALEAAGIKVLVAMLETFDSEGAGKKPDTRYREVYIHSKLLLVDDIFLSLGSANLNVRSMAGDSEINLTTADCDYVHPFRQRVWGNLAGSNAAGEIVDGGSGLSSQEVVKKSFENWKKRMKDNLLQRARLLPFMGNGFIVPFRDNRSSPVFTTG